MAENIKRFNKQNFIDQTNLEDKDYVDWHSLHTIKFGSLIDDGWDWGRNDWTTYSMKPENLVLIRERINSKIEDRFYFKELGILPPGRFKINLRSHLNSAIDYYGHIYDGFIDELNLFETKEKLVERHVVSDYPQSQLNTEVKDYASSAVERAHDIVKTRNPMEILSVFNRDFVEPDEAILKRIEVCFSQLITPNF